MSKSDWYQTEGWYAPLQNEAEKSEKPQKKKRKKLRRWIIVSACVLGVLALILVSSVIAARLSPSIPAQFGGSESGSGSYPDDYKKFFSQYYTSTATDSVEITMERARTPIDFAFDEVSHEGAEEYTLQELYQRCSDSIVGIYAYKDGAESYSWGSGVIISSGGLIVTNTHIIEGCARAEIKLADDTLYEAKLVGADGISDIAVLKIDAHDLPAAVIGDSELLSVGDHVAAIGNPLGEEYRLTMTDGIISATARGVNYNGHSVSLIQTNTALNSGNSGGALFNMYGEVVGITNMKKVSYYSTVEGMSFAIPTATVKTVVNGLLTNGKVVGRTSIGLTLGAINAATAEYYDLPEGLYVSGVSESSDAKAKGLQVGDIVTAVNGKTVLTTQEVVEIKDALSVGDEISLSVWRDGETFEVTIKLMDTNDVYK